MTQIRSDTGPTDGGDRTHPAVREAAVVGIADAYRGETIKAVVSLKPGHDVDPDGIKRGADGNWDRGAFEIRR